MLMTGTVPNRRSRRAVIGVVVVGAVALGVAAGVVAVGVLHPADGDKVSTQPAVGELPDVQYPASWESSYSEALHSAGFAVLAPDTEDANAKTVSDSFVSPNGEVVVLRYPLPAEQRDSSTDIRQQFIELHETARTDKEESDINRTDVEKYASPGKDYCVIDGIQGVCVEPRTDQLKSNAAFVRLAVNGVEIELSGGDDLGMLTSIAESLAAQARSGVG